MTALLLAVGSVFLFVLLAVLALCWHRLDDPPQQSLRDRLSPLVGPDPQARSRRSIPPEWRGPGLGPDPWGEER